jgi:hypothetical protein
MKWERHDRYSQVTDHYSVCAIGSKTGRITYEAWRREKHPLGRLMLAGNLPDALTARLACEADESHIAQGADRESGQAV